MNDVLYFNGRFTTTAERVLSVEDRGFQFGDAVYEVFKFTGKRPAFLLDHYRRMDRGLAEIEIPNPWDETEFAAVMRELMKYVDIAIANEEDVQMALGIQAEVDVHSGQLDRAQYEKLTARVLGEYPQLQAIAITLRESHSASPSGPIEDAG